MRGKLHPSVTEELNVTIYELQHSLGLQKSHRSRSKHQTVIFIALDIFPSSKCSLKFKDFCRTLDDEWRFLHISGHLKGLLVTALPLLHGQLLTDKLLIISH